jgi:hypothetical protein
VAGKGLPPDRSPGPCGPFVLAALALSDRINIWHILGLSMFQGAVNAFDIPARQTFVVEMIEDRADLSNAIALNSSMVNGVTWASVWSDYWLGRRLLFSTESATLRSSPHWLMNTKRGIPRKRKSLRELHGWRYIMGLDPFARFSHWFHSSAWWAFPIRCCCPCLPAWFCTRAAHIGF